MADCAAHEGNPEIPPGSEDMRKSSSTVHYLTPMPEKAASTIAIQPSCQAGSKLKRRGRVRERVDKYKDTEMLQKAIKHALGPLSNLIKQLRVLERKRDIFQLAGSKRQTEVSDIAVDPNNQRIENLEIERDEPSKDLSYWKEQCEQLTAFSDTLVNDIRRLQSSLDIQSEQELVEQFETLCYNIKDSCGQFSLEGARAEHTLSKTNMNHLLTLLGLDLKIDQQFLIANSDRVQLSRAYISRMLVNKIFCNGENGGGQVNDLWTSESTAGNLAEMESKMKEINLLPEEFNKWRSMTVRYLARKPLEGNARVKKLVDEVFKMLSEIFGVSGSPSSVARLREYLESDVVMKAVNLSQSLRKQLSEISVSIPTMSARLVRPSSVSSLSIEDGDTREECSENTIILVTTPAMFRFTDDYGAKSLKKRKVLVGSKRTHLRRKVIS